MIGALRMNWVYRVFAVGNHYKNILKKTNSFIFMRGNNTFVALWEQNDVFQSNRGSVVGA